MFSGPSRTVDQMEQDFRDLVATVQNEHLQELLNAVFGPGSPTWERFRAAPAAKHYHQAYAHGLLEHTVTVAQAVSALSGIFPGLDRDLAVSGALLHDIGKLDTYETTEERIEMTDDGRLQGEIVLGYSLVRAEIDRHPEFPHELRQALLHIILSHHGALEHGSPVVPCTREATLVHMADNLGSKLGSFDRIERGLDAGAQWANYDRGIGASAYFGLEGAAPELLAA
jgi:3'-5' exoribonuclease